MLLAIKLEAELLELKKENNHFLKKIKNKEDVNKENILIDSLMPKETNNFGLLHQHVLNLLYLVR